MISADYAALAARFPDETVTHAYVRDVELPGAGTLALVTLDNDLDHRRPTTLGPSSLVELGSVFERLSARAEGGALAAAAVTGKPDYLAAGADLSAAWRLATAEDGRQMARLGHEVYGMLSGLGVPTFAFINGAAMGGGLEIALAADYRTVSTAASGISLPEAFLGLIPGWGGVYRLPRLIGPQNALKVMIENARGNNRSLTGPEAFELGIADARFGTPDFLEQSLAWAGRILVMDAERARVAQRRAQKAAASEEDWDRAIAAARSFVAARTGDAAPAPGKLLEVLEAGRGKTQAESAALEIDALAELMQTPQFRDSAYAFLELVQKRAKRPAGAPDRALARPVAKVGVAGAGLMAGQLALLFARRLKVPAVMTDLDQAKVDKGVAYVHAEVDKLLAKNRLTPDAANRIKALVTGSVSKEAFADADFVIEAVFEDLAVKKQVLAEVEAVVSTECVLATNTSSLSVGAMAADLLHPERVVGFHFFNPVAAMPLLEIASAPKTTDEVLATAFALGQALKKTTVLVRDSAGFVVTRVLLRLLGEITAAFDEGTPADVADNALKPMGLPMTPFNLLGMVGLPVAQHVTESLHAAFGDRFRVSANLQRLIDAGATSLWSTDDGGRQVVAASTLALLEFGGSPGTAGELLRRIQDALAEEIGLMLGEGVVRAPEDIDLCMIMGAGWPLHLGGITPYLDRVGAAERATGRKFNQRR
jgi:3-hydroxyacyl-CoA dehydrogenase/enoyl-CoA hydratase/carnithine racemase